MLEELLSTLERGVLLGEDFICSSGKGASRPGDIKRFDLRLRRRECDMHLMCLAIFPGRRPYLRPWIELFCLPGEESSYYGSALEDSLLATFCSALGPGGRIFVEYQWDRETAWALTLGIDPALTRLGYKLYRLGCTWFKDWYFSEGGHEGSQKLQAEKPLNEEVRKRHMVKLHSQAREFLSALAEVQREEIEAQSCLARAADRAKELLAGDPR
jgi:hypothetical protein